MNEDRSSIIYSTVGLTVNFKDIYKKLTRIKKNNEPQDKQKIDQIKQLIHEGDSRSNTSYLKGV